MRHVVRLMLVAIVAATLLPTAAWSAEVEARVTGGGRADFLDTPNAVNKSGFTNFAIAAVVYSDSGASGHFVCQIPAVVVIAGEVSEGWVNDDGSVTVGGLAHGYDHILGEAFFDLPFTVTFSAGGPGLGGFDYRDESGFFGPGQFDTEVVRRGRIRIRD